MVYDMIQIHFKKDEFKNMIVKLNKNVVLIFLPIAFLSIYNLAQQFTTLGLILLIILLFSYLTLFVSKDTIPAVLALFVINILSAKEAFNFIAPYISVILSKYLTL